MGSCLSLRKVRETKVPIALVQIPRHKIERNSKSYRSFCSSSSGFSSTNTSPSKSSECVSNEGMKSFNIKRNNAIRILKRRPICDDFDEHKAFMQKYWRRNRSSGYYSASSPEPPQTRDVGRNCLESSITKSRTVTSDISTNASTMQNAASFCQIDFKLERLLSTETTPEVSEEWGSGWTGTNFIVEIEETETASSMNTDYYSSHEYVTETTNATNMTAQGPKIIVRTEEVLIVGLVLMLWVGAIILFFNRWGKIRMLEPYQPKFQQQHRASCLADTLESIPTHQRSSITRTSMGLVNNINMPACQFAMCKPALYSKGFPGYVRPRQNSVFVGSSSNRFFMPKPPRKTRSAMDLHSMVLDESAEVV